MTQQVWAPPGREVGRGENEYHLAPSRTSCKGHVTDRTMCCRTDAAVSAPTQ